MPTLPLHCEFHSLGSFLYYLVCLKKCCCHPEKIMCKWIMTRCESCRELKQSASHCVTNLNVWLIVFDPIKCLNPFILTLNFANKSWEKLDFHDLLCTQSIRLQSSKSCGPRIWDCIIQIFSPSLLLKFLGRVVLNNTLYGSLAGLACEQNLFWMFSCISLQFASTNAQHSDQQDCQTLLVSEQKF